MIWIIEINLLSPFLFLAIFNRKASRSLALSLLASYSLTLMLLFSLYISFPSPYKNLLYRFANWGSNWLIFVRTFTITNYLSYFELGKLINCYYSFKQDLPCNFLPLYLIHLISWISGRHSNVPYLMCPLLMGSL